MEGEEPLVFHDFLGIACQRPGESVNYSEFRVVDTSLKSKSKRGQVQEVGREEGAVKSAQFDDFSPIVVMSEHLSWPQGGSGALPGFHKRESDIRQAKRRDSTGSGEFSPQQLHMGTGADTTETSPYMKVSRLERLDDKRIGHVEARRDFTMQPPQVLSNLQSFQPSVVVKPGLPVAMPQEWDNSRHLASNLYAFRATQAGLLNLQSDKLSLSNIREQSAVVPGPPADEGSRTGLKGCSVGAILNSPSTGLVPELAGANHSAGRAKSWPQSAGSEPIYVASQQSTTPTSRQLTIFYGGQAHVYDDVPSDKADAIMTLAGSSGRSWSTMYNKTPRSNATASVPAAGGSESNKASQSINADGERSSISKASAVDCAGQIVMSKNQGDVPAVLPTGNPSVSGDRPGNV